MAQNGSASATSSLWYTKSDGTTWVSGYNGNYSNGVYSSSAQIATSVQIPCPDEGTIVGTYPVGYIYTNSQMAKMILSSTGRIYIVGYLNPIYWGDGSTDIATWVPTQVRWRD